MSKRKVKGDIRGKWVWVVEVRCVLRIFLHKTDAVEWVKNQEGSQWDAEHIQRKRIS